MNCYCGNLQGYDDKIEDVVIDVTNILHDVIQKLLWFLSSFVVVKHNVAILFEAVVATEGDRMDLFEHSRDRRHCLFVQVELVLLLQKYIVFFRQGVVALAQRSVCRCRSD